MGCIYIYIDIHIIDRNVEFESGAILRRQAQTLIFGNIDFLYRLASCGKLDPGSRGFLVRPRKFNSELAPEK